MITGAARRNTEVSLLVISLVIAVGGYWLASLSRSASVPAGVVVYAVIYAAIYAGAHFAIRKLAPRADPLLLPIGLMLNAIGFVLIFRLEIPTDNAGLAAAQTRWLDFSASEGLPRSSAVIMPSAIDSASAGCT